MGVYIKGMEMPKSCYVCPFCDYVSARCDAVNGNPYTPESRYEKRADFCPLIPVPPHGRLIDADAFRELLTTALNDPNVTSPVIRSLMKTIITAIDDAPIIIPAEEGET